MMSGLKNITDQLIAQTNAECEEILSAARDNAAASVAEARQKADEISAQAIKESDQRTESILQKAAADARSLEKRLILEEKVRLIDQTLQKACEKIKGLSDVDYFKALFAFAARERLSDRGTGVMYLNAGDLARMPGDFPAKLGDGIRVAQTPVDIEDGFILKYGDIEMNCTLKALFYAYREELKAKAAQLLF